MAFSINYDVITLLCLGCDPEEPFIPEELLRNGQSIDNFDEEEEEQKLQDLLAYHRGVNGIEVIMQPRANKWKRDSKKASHRKHPYRVKAGAASRGKQSDDVEERKRYTVQRKQSKNVSIDQNNQKTVQLFCHCSFFMCSL